MLYAVLLEDNEALGADVRRQHLPAHLSFLEKNAARIKAAGPLRASSGDPVGGLWLVEADSPDVVDALVKEDPILVNRIAALRSHSELVPGLRRRQAADLAPLPIMARIRPTGYADQCPQLGVERTKRGHRLWAVHDLGTRPRPRTDIRLAE